MLGQNILDKYCKYLRKYLQFSVTVPVTDIMCWVKRKYMQEYEVAETDLLAPKICWLASLLWLVRPTNQHVNRLLLYDMMRFTGCKLRCVLQGCQYFLLSCTSGTSGMC